MRKKTLLGMSLVGVGVGIVMYLKKKHNEQCESKDEEKNDVMFEKEDMEIRYTKLDNKNNDIVQKDNNNNKLKEKFKFEDNKDDIKTKKDIWVDIPNNETTQERVSEQDDCETSVDKDSKKNVPSDNVDETIGKIVEDVVDEVVDDLFKDINENSSSNETTNIDEKDEKEETHKNIDEILQEDLEKLRKELIAQKEDIARRREMLKRGSEDGIYSEMDVRDLKKVLGREEEEINRKLAMLKS